MLEDALKHCGRFHRGKAPFCNRLQSLDCHPACDLPALVPPKAVSDGKYVIPVDLAGKIGIFVLLT